MRNGKTGFDRIAQHIKAIRRFGRKGDNPNLPNDQRNLAADEELARIQAIQRSAGQPGLRNNPKGFVGLASDLRAIAIAGRHLTTPAT